MQGALHIIILYYVILYYIIEPGAPASASTRARRRTYYVESYWTTAYYIILYYIILYIVLLYRVGVRQRLHHHVRAYITLQGVHILYYYIIVL